MKNIFLILALFFIIPNQMQGNFENNDNKATIVISDDLMICNSYFKHKHDSWPVHYTKPLKIGENEHYFIPFAGTSVKIIVTKYK